MVSTSRQRTIVKGEMGKVGEIVFSRQESSQQVIQYQWSVLRSYVRPPNEDLLKYYRT